MTLLIAHRPRIELYPAESVRAEAGIGTIQPLCHRMNGVQTSDRILVYDVLFNLSNIFKE